MSLHGVIKTIRPSFLALSPICVLLGFSTALATTPQVNMFVFFVILLGAVLAHISVNMLNEYYDFKSGLDFKTKKTAFSGGSGALPDNPKLAKTVLFLGGLSLMATIAIGFYLAAKHGVKILPIGLLGILLIVTYTQWLNRSPLLCLIAPGLGFGILMVVGTHIMLTGEHALLPWLVSLVPFFLINNLLLLNQYPDIKADAAVGRKTFPIVFGMLKSNRVYLSFLLLVFILIVTLIINDFIPRLSVIVFVPLSFSLFSLWGAKKYTSTIGDVPQYLAANVAAALLTPLLLALAIIIG